MAKYIEKEFDLFELKRLQKQIYFQLIVTPLHHILMTLTPTTLTPSANRYIQTKLKS